MNDVRIQGVEANMAVLGSLTTPGTDRLLAILDMGEGSTDAAYFNAEMDVDAIHLAGAGDMVTMLIDSELGLDDRELAESIKIHPVAKAETLYSLRHEDGTVSFLDDAVPPETFGKVVLLTDEGLAPLDFEIPELVSDSLAEYGIVCGRGNVRGEMGPQNAVATGLALSYIDGGSYLDFDILPDLASARPASASADGGTDDETTKDADGGGR